MTNQGHPVVNEEVDQTIQTLLDSSKVKKALAQAEKEQPERIDQQVVLAETEAPSLQEEKRRHVFINYLKEAGLKDVSIDAKGNVISRYKGSGGPVLVIAAHLDTVFPAGTDLKVTKEGPVYHGPGICDDAAGLASLLQVVRCITEQDIKTVGDIVFVGTVCEETYGGLQGSKALWNDPNDYDGMIAIDSASPTRLLRGGVGRTQWRITFKGPGGHGLAKFGKVGSAIHGIGRLIRNIDETQVPDDPKSTFNIGTIQGGKSVNAIAQEAEIGLEIRSYDQQELEKLTEKMLSLVDKAIDEETERWNLEDKGKLTATVEQIGDIPAGTIPDDSPVLQAAYASMQKLGIPLKQYSQATTDSAIPVAQGIPATTLGAGGEADFGHSLNEVWDSKEAFLGPQLTLLTTLSLVGVEGLTKPLLPKLDH
ncbi:MAG: M20/M25/M40 family metallo-hydrolase [Burkholderiales bacterium]|nr:M20/M25/M40 family metallo-hydrolase [Burkholderiales bacterium]